MNNTPIKWNADLYQEYSNPQHRLGINGIKKLSPRQNEEILDIGCGNGLLTIEIAKAISGGRITAIELSSDMIAKAIDNAGRCGISNIRFLNMNALDISFSGVFDAVYSNSAIHWIHDLEKLYSLLFQSLKPGGRMLVQTGMREMNSLVAAIMSILQIERFKPYFSGMHIPWRFLTADETVSLLKNTGFHCIDVEQNRDRYQFNTREELSGYLASALLLPFLARLPEEERKGFMNFFVEKYIEENAGSCDAVTTRMYISARKP